MQDEMTYVNIQQRAAGETAVHEGFLKFYFTVRCRP